MRTSVREIDGLLWNINEKLSSIKSSFADNTPDELARFVQSETEKFGNIVSQFEQYNQKNHAGKLNTFKKFFSSTREKDFEDFKNLVTELLAKFEGLNKRVYDDLKNTDRIKAPETAAKKINEEIFLQKRKAEAIEDEIESLEKSIQKNKKDVPKLRKDLHDPRINDGDKANKEREINRLEDENKTHEENIENLKKSKKETLNNIKKLENQKHIIVSNANDIPRLFSMLLRCFEDCISRLRKLSQKLGISSKTSSISKDSKIGIEGPKVEEATLNSEKEAAKRARSRSPEEKTSFYNQKSKNVKKYNQVMKELAELRSIYSDNARGKIEDINKLSQSKHCGVGKLTISDKWLEHYAAVTNYQEQFYNARLDFLNGTRETPRDFESLYKSAIEFYRANKKLCDALAGNNNLNMNGLYLYDNNMGTTPAKDGKFTIPVGYKYWEALGYKGHDNTKAYTMGLQLCLDIAAGEVLKNLYNHTGSNPYWVLVKNDGRVVSGPPAILYSKMWYAINADNHQERALRQVELIIRASAIAGVWLTTNDFSK